MSPKYGSSMALIQQSAYIQSLDQACGTDHLSPGLIILIAILANP